MIVELKLQRTSPVTLCYQKRVKRKGTRGDCGAGLFEVELRGNDCVIETP
jgi:hypothetical protein